MWTNHFQPSSSWSISIVWIVALAAAGCMPQDPEGTLERVDGGVVRVGFSVAPPWTSLVEGAPSGIEAALVQRLAEELNARVEWRQDTEGRILHQLEQFELDVAICGLTTETPWKKTVALTLPYLVVETEEGKEEHVLAAPPGENAWLMHLEKFLHREKDFAEQQWRETR